ncbi:MAG TPA: dTMP kinase [Dehalococcoidia bacterium]|nr:dTMP kinase [Dehalococcoidia bacterium]
MSGTTRRGCFIAIEGGEGSGKSRLQVALGEQLRAAGHDVALTREPGGTSLGEEIRALVLAQRAVETGLAELLLFEAARAQLVATVIRPAIERGAVVICDRFSPSSVAYQGFGRGLGRDVVVRANAIATGGLAPDLTLLLDLPAEAGLARRAGAGAANHFDHETLAFHERVRAGYHDLARESPDTWRVIDAARPFDAVLRDAADASARVLAP